MIARSSQPGFKELIYVQTVEDLEDSDVYGPRKQTARNLAREMANRLNDAVQQAHAYYVDESMTDLIIWAAAGLDSTDAFRFDEVPTENGFIYLPKPIPMQDARGAEMLIHAIVWMPIWVSTSTQKDAPYIPGVAFYTFNDYNKQPDSIGLKLIEGGLRPEKYGRWGLVGIQSIEEGTRIGPEVVGLTEKKRESLIAEGANPTAFTNLNRIMHAYWLLLNQTITDVSDSEIPRQYAKRAKRAKLPQRVTIIRMRRREGHSHGETDVEWHHQWVVRGHWAWRVCGEDHPLAEPHPKGGFRARVWIAPYVKGPEDKPLVTSEKVIALVR